MSEHDLITWVKIQHALEETSRQYRNRRRARVGLKGLCIYEFLAGMYIKKDMVCESHLCFERLDERCLKDVPINGVSMGVNSECDGLCDPWHYLQIGMDRDSQIDATKDDIVYC